MHIKNNNKTNTFIQGLRPFSRTVPKTLKKYLQKGSYNYSNIVDNWTKMISKKISDASYPSSVKMGKNMKNGTLVLNVIHGKEMEIEYKKGEIMEKINSFFGYDCISHVTLKIIQDSSKSNYKVFPQIKNIASIKEKMSKIRNDELKNSLNNLLKAFNERNK